MRRRRPPAEPVEHHLAFLIGHADTVVVDRDLDPGARTDRGQLDTGGAAVLDGVRDRVVDGQSQPGGQPDDDHGRRGHQRHVEFGVHPHRVVRGPVEQFGDVDRDVVVERREFALGKPFEGAERGLDAGLRPDDVVEYFLALILGHVKGGKHFEVGPHRRQRGAQLVRRHRREVAAEASAALVRSCSSQMRCTRPLTASAISTASVAPCTSIVGFLVARIDRPRLLCQSLERTHGQRCQQPAEHRGGTDREGAEDDHPAVQVVGIADRRVVGIADRDRPSAPTAPGSRRSGPDSAPRRPRVGVSGGQLGQDDLRVGRDLVVLADGDDGVLVIGRLGDLVETARQERDREARRFVEAAVEAFLAVVGDAHPHDGADDRPGSPLRSRWPPPRGSAATACAGRSATARFIGCAHH